MIVGGFLIGMSFILYFFYNKGTKPFPSSVKDYKYIWKSLTV